MVVRRKLVPLLALVVYAGGCPHRQTAPTPAAEESWYRKENLFSAFEPGARDLSLANAYLLELACFVGDKGSFELDRTLETWGFTRRRDFRDLRTSTYGYVASNDRMVLVTFGGTDVLNLRDILSDADALELVYDERYCATPEARVHRGFRDSLSSVIDGVLAEVERQAGPPEGGGGETTRPAATGEATPGREGIAPPRKKLFIAGHSRGGALAVLAAAAVEVRGVDTLPLVAGVYTFGQPRVGNAAFARQFVSQTATGGGGGGAGAGGETARGRARGTVPLFRFVNRDDPIPSVPPETPPRAGAQGGGGYAHGGTLVALRDDGRVVRGTAADERRSLSLRDLSDPRASAAAVANHYQPAYQAALYAALADPRLVEESAWRPGAGPEVAQMLPRPVTGR